MTDQQQPLFDVGKWAEDQLALHQRGNAIDLYAVCVRLLSGAAQVVKAKDDQIAELRSQIPQPVPPPPQPELPLTEPG